jgi:hypothetical protein
MRNILGVFKNSGQEKNRLRGLKENMKENVGE